MRRKKGVQGTSFSAPQRDLWELYNIDRLGNVGNDQKGGSLMNLRRPNASATAGTFSRSRTVVPMSGICTDCLDGCEDGC